MEKKKETEMMKQFKELGIEVKEGEFPTTNNPFDVMIYMGIEILRDMLFTYLRIRHNNKCIQEHCPSLESIAKKFDMIETYYKAFQAMDKEYVEICRTTSHFAENAGFINNLNNYLCSITQDMQTTYSKYTPAIDMKFVKALYGEESEQVKNCERLMIITSSAIVLIPNSIDYLSSLCDVIDHGEEVISNGWMSKEEYEKRKKFIDENKLTIPQIKYMESVVEKSQNQNAKENNS